jgi:hypothetical protein
MTIGTLERLASLCGQSVASVATAQLVTGTARRLIALWVGVGDARGYSLRCAPDGWGLVVEAVPLAAADLGPYGRIEVIDEGDSRGQVLGVATLATPEAAEPFGVRLAFDDGRMLLIYNWGDELRVEQAPPPELEDVSYESLCGDGT